MRKGNGSLAKTDARVTTYVKIRRGKINYVNADHIHILIDLPFQQSLREVVKYFKGSFSHWINQNKLTKFNFNWGRGFGAFSVSQSNISKVAKYIATQNEHHHKRSFMEEYKDFIKAYGLQI